jgi:hypothetical protein
MKKYFEKTAENSDLYRILTVLYRGRGSRQGCREKLSMDGKYKRARSERQKNISQEE